jgi:hypothetical protein
VVRAVVGVGSRGQGELQDHTLPAPTGVNAAEVDVGTAATPALTRATRWRTVHRSIGDTTMDRDACQRPVGIPHRACACAGGRRRGGEWAYTQGCHRVCVCVCVCVCVPQQKLRGAGLHPGSSGEGVRKTGSHTTQGLHLSGHHAPVTLGPPRADRQAPGCREAVAVRVKDKLLGLGRGLVLNHGRPPKSTRTQR